MKNTKRKLNGQTKVVKASFQQVDVAYYLVKVKLKNLEDLLKVQDWSDVEGVKDVSICEFSYRAKSWQHSRTLNPPAPPYIAGTPFKHQPLLRHYIPTLNPR